MVKQPFTNRAGGIVFLTEEEYQNKLVMFGQDAFRPSTQEEYQAYTIQLGIVPEGYLDVFFPYWSRQKPSDGYGGVALSMQKYQAAGKICLNNIYKNQKYAIVFATPEGFGTFCKEFSGFNGKKIAYTMFETTKWPQSFIDNLQKADLILVPTNWCKEVITKQGLKPPVEVLEHGIDPNYFKYKSRDSNPEIFKFLHYNAGNFRKGFPLYLQAFLQEFREDEPVEFIAKSFGGLANALLPYSIYPNIKIINKDMTREEQESLLHECHCFVFPSRGEGFGLPPLEAVASGMPCILTQAHSHLDHWNDGYYGVEVLQEIPARYGFSEFPIDKEQLQKLLVETHPNRKSIESMLDMDDKFQHFNSGNWYECSIPSLRKQMRQVVNDWKKKKDNPRERARKGSDYLRTRFTYPLIMQKLRNILESYFD